MKKINAEICSGRKARKEKNIKDHKEGIRDKE